MTTTFACSNKAEEPAKKLESNLEIFSWWIAPGEVEALDAVLAVYADKYPDVEVTNAAALDAQTQRERLKTRLETGEPPDSFQAVSGVDILRWVDAGKMSPITAIAEEQGWYDVIPAAVLDTLSKDGELYAVPMNIERDNYLYYSTEKFKTFNLEPPTTLEDFYAVCDALHAEGEEPLAIPAAGWVLALVGFENLFPAVTGGEFYLDYFKGKADPNAAQVTDFVEAFDRVVACSNVGSATSTWSDGADALKKGEVAMFVMGDWAKAYLETGNDPWKAGTEFGMTEGLGSTGLFTFNSAVFGLPKNLEHPKAARAFLEVIGSTEGQEAFNPIKGSLPARTDVDLADFDAVSKRAAEQFLEAANGENRLLPGYASLTTNEYQTLMNPSLLVFAVGGAKARELAPEDVPENEAAIEARDQEYLLSKLRLAYELLKE